MADGVETTRNNQAGLRLGEIFAYLPDGSTIPDETWARRHKGVVVLALLHIPILVALSVPEGRETVLTGAQFPQLELGRVLLQTGLIAGFALVALISRLPRRLQTISAVTALAFCSGTLVYVSGGYIEAHFHFFVVTGVYAIYEDWLPFAVGIAYVVVTHIAFGIVDPASVYNHQAAQLNPWVWSLIHGGFVAMLAGALTVHLSSIQKSREEVQRHLAQMKERATRIDNLEQRQQEIEAKREEAERLKREADEQRAEVEELNDHLQTKATEYRDALMAVTDGDLTVRVDPESKTDAMEEIGEACNEMIAENERVIKEIQEFTGEVKTQTEQAESGVQEAAKASASVSDSVQRIATGADEQREMLDTITNQMTDLSATVEEVAASADSVAKTSNETTRIVTDGEEVADEMLADARAVEDSMDTVSETVATLNAQMDEIADITDLISEIAEQTNMLALNANIEAARAGGNGAGDAGEGFSVVANEVKSLAEQTRESASEIQDRIEETQEQTDLTVSQVEQVRGLIQKEIQAAEEMVDSFVRVAENARESNNGIQEISRTTDEQASSSEEVVAMLDEIGEISTNSAESAQSASAGAEEQAASMDEIKANASRVSEQVRELESLLGGYTVSSSTNAHSHSLDPDSSPTASDGGVVE